MILLVTNTEVTRSDEAQLAGYGVIYKNKKAAAQWNTSSYKQLIWYRCEQWRIGIVEAVAFSCSLFRPQVQNIYNLLQFANTCSSREWGHAHTVSSLHQSHIWHTVFAQSDATVFHHAILCGFYLRVATNWEWHILNLVLSIISFVNVRTLRNAIFVRLTKNYDVVTWWQTF